MTKLGKIAFTLVFLALVIFGVSKWWNRLAPENLPQALKPKQATSEVELAATQTEIPRLVAPAPTRRRIMSSRLS
jgi:Na+-transporting methylmalonyl-CoA/oxaloacetate decarboxylase gamma subunit